jgi:predicted Zn-dependent peptidase
MHTKKLSNGIPVVINRLPGTQAMTILILFKVGSRYETKTTNGISHFLEHLFFKGTTNRPTSLDIAKELDGVGAGYNAFTSKDYTGYYVKVGKKHARLAVDVISDLLLNPLFEQEEIDRERGVIIEEINMYEDNPMATAEILSEMELFGKNHPLGYDIAGPKDNIRTVTRNQIMKYRDTHYRTDNMVIAVAGNVPASVYKDIDKAFSVMEKPKTRKPKPKKFVYKQRSPRVLVQKKPTAQSHLALSFPGPTYTQKDAAAYRVLARILGGGMSSRLFIQVRERKGLCYYIRAGLTSYEDQGAFTIQAGFDTKRINKAADAIIEQLQLIRDEGVTKEELQQAKDGISGAMSIQMEDSENVAQWWSNQALFQKTGKTVQQYERAIQKVTKKQVEAVAQKMFKSSQANLVIVGPYTKAKEKTMRKKLQQL